MALVLKERKNPVTREVSSLKVVKAASGNAEEVLQGVGRETPGWEDEFLVMDGSTVEKYRTGYRIVQDVQKV